MTEHDRVVNALRRIASATNVVRTRMEDTVRRENRGNAVQGREVFATRLEYIADELERVLKL